MAERLTADRASVTPLHALHLVRPDHGLLVVANTDRSVAFYRDRLGLAVAGHSDNYGIGLRLNLPIGPLRLDYGIPINHDQYSGSSGRFQFGVGYTREF